MNRGWLIIPVIAFSVAVSAFAASVHVRPQRIYRRPPVRVAAVRAAGIPAPSAVPESAASLPEAPEEPEPRATLIAVGDLMLSRTVGAKISERGASYPFEAMTAYLHDGDIVFGNLETSITAGKPVLPGEMMFRADPGVEIAMKDAGFTVLSLANNHVPNFGGKGVLDTIAFLDKAGITHAGAGKDTAAARAPALVEAGGLTVAFLAYNDSDVVPASYGATDSRAGTNLIDAKKLPDDIKGARERADVVVVSMHSGTEYVIEPNKRQRAFAHAAIDAGADLVIGHHPHVVQRAETYKGKFIFYSLGNFVFDQMWSAGTRRGLALKMELTKSGVESVAYQPVLIEDSCRPRPLDGKDGGAVVRRLGW